MYARQKDFGMCMVLGDGWGRERERLREREVSKNKVE